MIMRQSAFLSCALLLVFMLHQIQATCPYKCDCTNEPSHCPAGVSLVTDDCNCCRVCAKQVGQQCNDYDEVCDVHRSLFCDYSSSRSGDVGTCTTRTGKSCPHDDVRVANGFMFEPSCKTKTRCWCMDGAVGCVPLCPHETQVPRSDRCPNARLQGVPDQCCDQWVCDTSSGPEFLPVEELWSDYVRDEIKSTSPVEETPSAASYPRMRSSIGNRAVDDVIYEKDEGANGDELFDYQMNKEDRPQEYDYVTYDDEWSRTNQVPGEIERRSGNRKLNCQSQASSWSPCSKTCGLGISTRVTNMNRQCMLKREARLCELRPCLQAIRPKFGRRCSKQRRVSKRITIKYAGCTSTRTFRPKFCGVCQESNRCCTPQSTRTIRIKLACPDGQHLYKNVMVIRNCHCHRRCNRDISADPLQAYKPNNYVHLPLQN